MKKYFVLGLVVIGMVLVGAIGCKKSDNVDTSRVERAFQSSPNDVKSNSDQIVSAVKAGNYSGALTMLQTAVTSAKITPEQKTALEDLGTQIKNKLTETAKKAGDEMSKAGQDVQKSAQDATKNAQDLLKK